MLLKRSLLFVAVAMVAPWSAATGIAAVAPELQGGWESACQSRPSQGLSFRLGLYIENDQFVAYTQYNSDDTCTEPTVTDVSRGHLVVRPARGGAGLLELDFTLTRLMEAPMDSVSELMANGFDVCGKDNWRAPFLQDISSTDCTESDSSFFPAVSTLGSGFFDLAEVNKNLYLGLKTDDHNGRTPAQRPSDIDRHIEFHRKDLAAWKGAAKAVVYQQNVRQSEQSWTFTSLGFGVNVAGEVGPTLQIMSSEATQVGRAYIRGSLDSTGVLRGSNEVYKGPDEEGRFHAAFYYPYALDLNTPDRHDFSLSQMEQSAIVVELVEKQACKTLLSCWQP